MIDFPDRRVLRAFFKAWKERNLKVMYINTTLTWQWLHDQEKVGEMLSLTPIRYKTLKIEKHSEVIADVTLKVWFHERVDNKVVLRMVRESAPYNASPLGDWGIYPNSIKRIG